MPLSTLRNWSREFAKWAPTLNTVTYVGDGESRKLIRETEFAYEKLAGGTKFTVLLTTPEMVTKDATELHTIPWQFLVVDEAHRCDPVMPLLLLLLLLHACVTLMLRAQAQEQRQCPEQSAARVHHRQQAAGDGHAAPEFAAGVVGTAPLPCS